jgi:hypothetical protein
MKKSRPDDNSRRPVSRMLKTSNPDKSLALITNLKPKLPRVSPEKDCGCWLTAMKHKD